MSIEEAFEALMATYGSTAHGDGPDAARNLLMVLLDELTAPDAGLCCPADAEFVAGVRAQIERLWKEPKAD